MKKLMLILMCVTASLSFGQTTVFGTFGTISDTVTALYESTSDLYIGARTTVANDRTKKYNGSAIVTLGYNPATTAQWTGGDIQGIGRVPSGVVFYDYSKWGTSGRIRAHEYNGSTWGTYIVETSGTNGYIGSVMDNPFTSTNSVVGGSFTGQAYPVLPSTTFAPVYVHGSTLSEFSWTALSGQITDFELHGGNLYACGGFTSNFGVMQTSSQGSAWTNSGIVTINTAFMPQSMESYNGDLYIVMRFGIGVFPYTGFADSVYVWNGATFTNTGIGGPATTIGSIQDMEVHDGKLFIGGTKLMAFDGSTWTTYVASFPASGQIFTMESYGTKLAFGGSFSQVNGNSSQAKLAYLEIVPFPVASFTVDNVTCEGVAVNTTNSSTGSTPITYAWSMPGATVTSSTLSNPGPIVYPIAGSYIITLTVTDAVLGDSTITQNITVNPVWAVDTYSNISTCDSYMWTNGTEYFSTGTYSYIEPLSTVFGCDSIVTHNLDLTINNNSSLTVVSTCDSYMWTDGNTYTSTGTFNQTLVNVSGCDSVATLDLTIFTSPVAIATDNGDATITSSAGASYEWIDCSTGDVIPGETDQTLTVTANGDYAVVVTNLGSCSDTSSCVNINYVGVGESDITDYIKFVNGMIISTVSWNLFDMGGRLVMSGASGEYVIPVGMFIISTEFGNKKIINYENQ